MPNGAVATKQQIQEDSVAWSTSFARDQRACQVQNHDHDCTGTCVKYNKKKNTTECSQRSGAKLKGAGVPQCRFRYFRKIILKIGDAVRHVLRRGKDLVDNAFIATGQEENEYGKAVVPRGHPFRSSSQDVLQVTVRCNADYQYQKRAVPAVIATENDATVEAEAPATEQDPTPKKGTVLCRLFYGCRLLTRRGREVLTTLATAMRAANIADFYMTKYQSKPQEALAPTIQPLIAGMRRQEEAECAPDAEGMSLLQRARQRIRRLIFSANRTHWLSACELCVFLRTRASCVKTEPVVKVFSGKGFYMAQECKRLLNNEATGQGLLFAAGSGAHTDANPMQTFAVQQPRDHDAEHHVHDNADGESTASDNTGQDSSYATEAVDEDENDDVAEDEGATADTAAEHVKRRRCAAGEDENDAMADDERASAHGKQSRCNKQAAAGGAIATFSKSTTKRDDWLHRGRDLHDMDTYHYMRYIDRVELPRGGTAQGFQHAAGVFFLFDAHYPMSKNYVQVLNRYARTVQNVGPQCLRSDVGAGEDNALYKAVFFSPMHCMGADECANPLICRQVIFPSTDEDKNKGRAKRFAPAWKARRAEIEILADRAARKQAMSKRIGVIHDSTLFKAVPIGKSAATEQVFEQRMLQILFKQLVFDGMPRMTNAEHVLEQLLLFCDIPLPWHPEQSHLAEWQAYSAREILFNLDMSVEARNLAKQKALQHKGIQVEDDEDISAKASKLTVEDLGGTCAEEDMLMGEEDTFRSKERMQMPQQRVFDILIRKTERDMAKRPGRTRDQHKEMERVAEVFGTQLDEFAKPFHTKPQTNAALGLSLHEALAHQKDTADRIRQQQDVQGAEPMQETLPEAEVIRMDPEVKALLKSMPDDLSDKGPLAVAKHLVDGATLNDDQKAPVALTAHIMQAAWEKQGKPKVMERHGALLRLLLLGGGGCGKSRIINFVLTALFRTFWGPRGCVLMAPSNKAARNIYGKTMHAASKMRGGTMKMIDLRAKDKTSTALACLYVPCGALIIDEVPQGAAPLYHAVSLRSTYGRASAYDLELSDYADASQTFGAMPIVIECGDELQLPPVPASAGLFAELEDVSAEHRAGLQIFKQKDYVYRLTTMKRFKDDIQISILTKMRQSGGCKLTTQEWKALQNTELTTLSATERSARLRGTELWYQAAPTWATVSMAQAIRSRCSAQKSETTLYIIPAEDYVLDRPYECKPEHLAEEILRTPNMNNTGRLPGLAMVHIGMEIRLTQTVEAPDAVVDSTGVVRGLDLEPEDDVPGHPATRVLRQLPKAIIVKLKDVETEFLPPKPCAQHVAGGADRACAFCDFRPGCIAITPKWSQQAFKVEVTMPAHGNDTELATVEVKVQRRQVPVTIKTASTLHTLQGTTAEPGLIFHWKFPRFMSPELRWLATYVALSRPASLSQLLSVGMPAYDLREILEGGPPEGILTRFKAMFQEKEVFTHEMAEKIMLELGWKTA